MDRQMDRPTNWHSRSHSPVLAGCGSNMDVVDNIDLGWYDSYRGWYDTSNCGSCLDYCRWVGESGSGGDPTQRLTFEKSNWMCVGQTNQYEKPQTWNARKCFATGAKTPGRVSARVKVRVRVRVRVRDRDRVMVGGVPLTLCMPFSRVCVWG